ncbi:MAG: putative toxin-antitoxin system toxin component, PIN family [Flavobacteriaceae bacterium]|jgi:putative PIN family toxin of toxin-antitoxin system|nr:putative toxin-antitoxin system toxin component, PIN family [Flavobacteriaceae bacterium]
MQKYKIIIDTNLWISLLIGKRLSEMQSLCNDDSVVVYGCNQLRDEFLRVAHQNKIKKYVDGMRIEETLELMETSCEWVLPQKENVQSELRDVKDLYLLALADTIEADYLITGDKDLLTLKAHNKTKILTYKEFETMMKS